MDRQLVIHCIASSSYLSLSWSCQVAFPRLLCPEWLHNYGANLPYSQSVQLSIASSSITLLALFVSEHGKLFVTRRDCCDFQLILRLD